MYVILHRFTIKASILAGAIYTTADQGLWKDTDSADEAYQNLYNIVAPYVKEVPVEVGHSGFGKSPFNLKTEMFSEKFTVILSSFSLIHRHQSFHH